MRKCSLSPATTGLLAVAMILSGCSATDTLFHRQAPVTAESGTEANYQAALKLGDKARADKKLDEAASQYARAARWMPGQAQPLVLLADVLWEMKNPAEAAKALVRAREMEPDNTLILRNLGRAYVALNQPDPAQETYRAALAIEPQDVRALNGLGVATDMTGAHEEAQQHYRDGLAIQPQNLELQNNLAYSLVASGQYREAVDILEPLSKRADATPRQRQNLALAYGLLGKDDEARRVAKADLTPAQVEKNIEIYNHLKVEPRRPETLRAVGRPTQARGSFIPSSADVAPAPAMAPAPSPVAAPDQIPVADATDASMAAPVTLAPETTASQAADQPIVLGRMSESSSAPTAVPPAAMAPSKNADAAKAGRARTKDATSGEAPASLLPDGVKPVAAPPSTFGGNRVYLGMFPTEAAARDSWVKVWVKNSTLLGSMAASVEPQGGQVALYAVGAESAEKAESVCTSLRQNGVSCGVAR